MNLDRVGHVFLDFDSLSLGLRGRWTDAQTFLLEHDTIVNYYYYQLAMRFDGDRASFTLGERTGAPLLTVEGKVANP
jgi:hypothetical protein